jgi:diguanylate cyclase (GGDEF)-like protein
VLKRRSRIIELEGRAAAAMHQAAELRKELERQAGKDPLTGLLSLRSFRARLETEVDRGRRHGGPLSLVVLDLDGFRALNARHGHAAGDEVLVSAARVLTGGLRATDVAGRIGGDAFGLLLVGAPVDGALRAVERVLLELGIAETPAVRSIPCSAGVVGWERGQRPEQLLGAAERALDRARRAGGGHAVVGSAAAGGSEPDDAHANQAVIDVLVQALSERDRYTAEHSDSVTDLVVGVGSRLGVDGDDLKALRAASLLHDIGKVAIPDHILNKPAPLDAEEWELMKQHTIIGERILRSIPGMNGTAKIVRHEHERWDGNGYPDGLAGDAIPIGSRIILTCDAYHAMTSDRPYRPAMTHAAALEELTRHAGTQFDPEIVGILIGDLHAQRQTGAAYGQPGHSVAATPADQDAPAPLEQLGTDDPRFYTGPTAPVPPPKF